jgi:hypothetical protein
MLLSQSGYESRFYKETALIRPLASWQILLSASAHFLRRRMHKN